MPQNTNRFKANLSRLLLSHPGSQRQTFSFFSKWFNINSALNSLT